MAVAIDILHLFPALTEIRQPMLQAYCDEWLRRPIAREYGIAQIAVDERSMLTINLAAGQTEFIDEGAFIPVDELLGYIIDRHLADPDARRSLHASVREARQRWGELGRDYEATLGRVGTLYLSCKNPECRAIMESNQQAHEGQQINYGPIDIECLTCGQIHSYVGSDFQVKIAK